jgi:hypothetical protein
VAFMALCIALYTLHEVAMPSDAHEAALAQQCWQQ